MMLQSVPQPPFIAAPLSWMREHAQRWSRSQLNRKGELYNITLMLILDGLFSLLFIVFEFHLV